MDKKISVCIATYKRPALLEKLLDSIVSQKNIDDYNIEIIVVDNDVNKSAEKIVNKFKANLVNNPRFTVKYDMQPQKNISLTRNKTVELATGEYLFFIDDDEYADDYCIYNHIDTINRFNADISIGNVYPYFDKELPFYIKNAEPFFKINNKTGSQSKFFATSNTMIIFKELRKDLIFFNPYYGITGGEDSELFSILKKRGFKVISCAISLAYEYIPLERANLKWLIKRVFRTGNTHTRTLLQCTDSASKKFFIGISQFLKGIFQFFIALILSLLFLLLDKTKSLNWFLRAVSNLSKPLAVFGFYPKEYKT